jgi:hypothetical protein
VNIDRTIVSGKPGNGTTTLLQEAVVTLMGIGVLDAAYVDLSRPDLRTQLSNIPALVTEALCAHVPKLNPVHLCNDVRQALAGGWLKPFFDNVDLLSAEQRGQLFGMLMHVPKWSVACGYSQLPFNIQHRNPAIHMELLGPPTDDDVRACIGALKLDAHRRLVRMQLAGNPWLRANWLSLTLLCQSIARGDFVNAVQIAEAYVRGLCTRIDINDAPLNLMCDLGRLALEYVYGDNKAKAVDAGVRRSDYGPVTVSASLKGQSPVLCRM